MSMYRNGMPAADLAGLTWLRSQRSGPTGGNCVEVAFLPSGSVIGDVNTDGLVNCTDVSLLRASFGKRTGQPGFNLNADLNNDGVVDIRDLMVVTRQLPAGTTCQ